MKQLHKKFTDYQIKDLIIRYLKKKIARKYIQEILGIKKTRFFALIKQFKDDPENFSVSYFRSTPTRTISKAIEANVIKELKIEKDLIKAKDVPIRCYSCIKDILENDYKQKVSLSIIINRAKANDFYLTKPKRKVHNKEVITNYPGEMIQQDSSYHQFSPCATNKWYLITSLDDYSRLILYAVLVERETTWTNIIALKIVILRYGIPYSYYVDSYSVYRFVQGRDSNWRTHHKFTDEADPQWKQVLNDCGVRVKYTLSPQAKGKIERPYRWIQDKLVRSCYRKKISDINQGQLFLNSLIQKYNHQWIHSTTREIPCIRFQRALKENKSLFREFAVRPPYKLIKDIFCLRADRMVNSYRKVSINNLELKVPSAPLHERIQLRITPDKESGLSEVRFWHEDDLLGIQKVKNSDLNLVQF